MAEWLERRVYHAEGTARVGSDLVGCLFIILILKIKIYVFSVE